MSDITTLMMAAAGAGGAEETDPNFNQTVLLLHGDGTNGAQNNTFLDSSTNNFTITRNGNTTQGTFSPFSAPDGRWSNYFDGTDDRLVLPVSQTPLLLGSSDFTFECWVYRQSANTQQLIFGGQTDLSTVAGSGYGFQIGSAGTTDLYSGASTVYQVTSPDPSLNVWSHIAYVRTGGTFSTYLNGTRIGTRSDLSTNAVNNGSTSYPPVIGSSAVGTIDFTGYISNARLIKGSGGYDATGSTITVPTSPLTAVANTSLLTCQSNRFVDNSTNTISISIADTPKVTPFSPFAPTAAYSPSVNGGSAYFDGSGDALYPSGTSADLALGSGDFTIEFWLYTPRGATRQYVLDNRSNGAGGFIGTVTGIGVIWGDNGSSGNGNQFRYFSQSSGTVIADADLLGVTLSDIANQWNHIAIVRSSGTVYGFLNGVRKNSVADATNFNVNTSISIGAAGDNSAGFLGNISNFRVVKGTAVYTGTTYTAPTAPLTAVSGTELLCNFTNAGIFDNTGKNNLETVGNAQIDTTTKKYGAGSMEFDGTGDWLKVPNSPDLQLGTGDFTIEFWVYLASGDTGSARGLVAKGGASTGWLVSLDSSEKVVFTYTTSTITSSGAITTNAWNHIAVVREGTGSNETKIYIGGTNDGTGTVSTDFNQTEVMYIGANRAAGDPMKGYIDDLRITKGVARYTTTFTPPTKAFPDL